MGVGTVQNVSGYHGIYHGEEEEQQDTICDDVEDVEDGVEEDRMDVEPGQEEEHEGNGESDDDMDDEEDEDDEDEHRLEPIMDGRNVRAQQRFAHTHTPSASAACG